MIEFNTPILVEVKDRGPALVIGAIDRPGQELAWVVIAKDGGAITVEPISNLRGSGIYVTGQQTG